MSLFTKPINEITIDDVISFCEQGTEEGIRLDYKRDFSGTNENRQIAKILSAFANTYGGILLLGVDEKDRKPILPISGIDYFDGLDEKITSIALTHINPPVIPEIQICHLKDNTAKAVVAIRINESDETPHRIDQDTKVYIRVRSQSEPVEAPFEKIEFLLNRREKAELIKYDLLERAEKRALLSGAHSYRSIRIIPLYPHEKLITYLKLSEIIQKTVVAHEYEYSSFPFGNKVTLQESVIYNWHKQAENGFQYYTHTEVNSFGLIFNREIFMEDIWPQTASEIGFSIVVEKMYTALLFAQKFYKEIGFQGLIQIDVIYTGIKRKNLITDHYINSSKNEFDDDVSINRKLSVYDLSEKLREVIVDICKEFLWSFNAESWAKNDALINKYIEDTENKIFKR